MRKSIISIALCIFSLNLLAQDFKQDFKIVPLKSSIIEELFQTIVAVKAVEALGYEVRPIEEVSYSVAFESIAQHYKSKDVYFIPTNWDPLHNNMLESAGGDSKFYKKGIFVSNCAQGYLIDKKTAQKYNIKYINDLKDPKIAKLFDSNGDGKADLSGCNPGWGCEKVIEHQLDAFGLRDSITHNQGEYSAIMADTISRYKKGSPILYYTWTPYWISGMLVPNRDVVWLQVTHSSHPVTKDTSLPNGANYGFNVNSQHIVANKSIETLHKDIAKLFEIMKIDINDISAENMLITQGEDKESDVLRHANLWIKANQSLFDSWIKTAKAAK